MLVFPQLDLHQFFFYHITKGLTWKCPVPVNIPLTVLFLQLKKSLTKFIWTLERDHMFLSEKCPCMGVNYECIEMNNIHIMVLMFFIGAVIN